MTDFSVFVTYGAASLSACLGVLALVRVRRAFSNLAFGVGMLGLAAEAVFTGLCLQSIWSDDLARWQHLRLAAASIVPGSWLLFSLSYSRENYRDFIRKWRWALVCAYLLPISLVWLGAGQLFVPAPETSFLVARGIRVGWSGYFYQVLFLLGSVTIVAMLEGTLRATHAKMRWRIKFMILGIGGLFAIRIYSASQVLLFSFIDAELITINTGALAAADLLIILSLIRSRLREVTVQVSPAVMRGSLTVLIVGIYLLVIGLSAKLARYLGVGEAILQNAFFVFLAILGLVVILLSDQLRNEIRRFLARHFRQPLYDYRHLWTLFTQRTSCLFEMEALGSSVVNTVSETFGCSAVSLWTIDEVRQQPQFCASTFLSERYPEDFRRNETEVAITVGSEFLGLMTLNERMTGDALAVEDLDLLKTMGDQTAGLVLNCQLYERLGQAKEKEAFQTFSAFFVHDLKNLASTLSPTLQSLPLHYDNPEFRDDMLKVISQSLKKLDSLCNRLGTFKKKLELQLGEADLGELVTATVNNLNADLKNRVVLDLQPVPSLRMDCDQIQNVLVNLLLNANEATSNDGEIRVGTGKEKDYATLVVSDSGCGMTPEFLKHSLFHPFKTTKNRGLGIGLYQSRMIVEAHQGRIEVESEEGRGSVFRVLLPLNSEQ
jgi:signal transduction histidine kinase